ncbi:hypothetical protein [Paracoccus sanguinis]|uniref:hypothetical protein n=1 Tax=Paracoccus sanguinis TaxID=1545044 RepID=UPI00051FA7DE|nr:hypothetical protein [Paracoccus sanguinis]KGJ15136.1 hypothetical protein IX54_03420 [Paracoccus sanguinis]
MDEIEQKMIDTLTGMAMPELVGEARRLAVMLVRVSRQLGRVEAMERTMRRLDGEPVDVPARFH